MTSTCASIEGCPKTVIVGLVDLANELQIATEAFMTTLPFEGYVVPDYQKCYKIVSTMVEDKLAEAMIWTRCRRGLAEDLLDEYLPWFKIAKNDERYEELYGKYVHDVLDSVELKISHILTVAIPTGTTWDIWTTTPLGNDLLMTKGLDYRVVDWERRMKSGLWSMDDNIDFVGLDKQLFETFSKPGKRGKRRDR